MSKKLIDIAREIYGDKAEHIVKSFDLIGDIAVIKIPPEILDNKRFQFGEEIIKAFPYVKVVLRQTSPVEGIYRVRGFEHLAGEKRTETIYKEHGARFYVDISRVYFTPRLSYERKRIADKVTNDEKVFNMFAGAGPFTILMARKGAKVHSVDINPYAVEYHYINNILNKVENQVVLYRDDAANVASKHLVNKVDRVVMPLPEIAMQYLPYALQTINGEGWIHIYLHIKYLRDEDEALETAISDVERNLKRDGALVKDIDARVVREVATRTAQVCVDVKVVKRDNHI